MSLIFSNEALDLTATGAVWVAAIPFDNTTLGVYNEQARATTLDLGRGSTDAPTAAQKFGAQLSWKGGALAAIVLQPDDVLDLRTLGIFFSKGEDFTVVSGTCLKKTRVLGELAQSTKYGQIGIFETGAIIELNCSQEAPDEAPEFWELDPVVGWQQINVWDVPAMLEPI
jgi:hypothetical protein